ncbi:uncharacterized protein EDB93DRAFT_1109742 [Suillus bovinus]|uniref:uncharacterized protein n=1 Tax=Suillus bovinus TaxID=48563 RepID=UPI001B87A62F|nr:uncharacterized protein EDB93DRAFT_1109742 [Suillus bovinus]KAG2126255.1 hypothetical protein EDB93DRAFT_1109742 [Suillus bovinus]
MISGTRVIFNVKYPNQVIDLQNGGSADGTPIIGYQFDSQNTNPHQRWLIEVIDSNVGGNKFTTHVTNNGTGKYVRAEPEILNQGLVSSHIATKWTLVKQNDMGQYFIQGNEGDLVLVLPDDQNYTQLKLAVPDESDERQLWTVQDM